MNNSSKQSKTTNLRQKAEALLKKKSSETGLTLSEIETLKLVHELEVHQIELELINEEIMLASSAAQNASEKYSELFDFAPSGYFILSKEGKIIDLNICGAQILGKERAHLKNSQFGFFVSNDTLPIFNLFLEKAFSSKVKETCEVILSVNDNLAMYVQLTGVVAKNSEQCLVTLVDITESKRAQALLQYERDLNLDIIKNQPSGIYRIRVAPKEKWLNNAWISKDYQPYTYDFINDRFCKILGVEKEILINNPGLIVDLVHPDDRAEYKQKNEEANENLTPFKWECRLIVDGKIIWAHFESLPRLLDNGEVLWTGFLYDISELKHSEESLRESEKEYRNLLDMSPIAKCILRDWTLIYVNQSAVKLFGAKSSKDLVNKSILELIHPDFHKLTHENSKLLAEKGFVPKQEQRFVRIDGNVLEVETQSKSIIFNGKQATLVDISDITERKKADIALKSSEDKFKKAFMTSPDSININRLEDGMYVSINNGFTRITGYTEEDILGKTSIEKNIWVDLADRNKLVQGLKEKGLVENLVAQFCTKSGVKLYGMMSASIIELDGVKHILNITRDITEIRKTELALQKSEEQLRLSTELANVAVWEFDFNTNSMARSKNHDKLYGLEKQEVWKYETFMNATHPDDREYSDQVIQNSVKIGGSDNYKFDFRVIHPDQSIHWLMVTGQVVERDSEGRGIIVRGTLIDITDRKMTEMALFESQKLLQGITDNSSSLIYALDIEGSIKLINKSLEKVYGLNRDTLTGKKREEFMPTEIAKVHRTNDLKVIETRQPITFEEENYESDGKHTYLSVKFPLIDLEGNLSGIAGISTDITERKKAEKSLEDNRILLNKLLSESTQFIDSNIIEIDYAKITNTIHEISGAKFSAFNLTEPDGLNYKTIAFSGRSNFNSISKKFLGFDFYNKKWNFDPIRAEKIKDKTISRFNTLRELNGHLIPKNVSIIIEKTFNLGEVFVVKINKNTNTVGDFTLVFTKGTTLQNSKILELYANQVAFYIDRFQSEVALRENRAVLDAALSSMTDAVFISDKMGSNLEFNEAFATFHKFKNKDECSGKLADYPLLIDVFTPTGDFVSPDMWVVRKALRGETAINEEYKLLRKDTGETWIGSYSYAPILDNMGTIMGSVVVARDITEKKQAENDLRESEQKLSILFASMTEMVAMHELVFNEKGEAVNYRIIDCNKTFSEHTGIKKEDIIGKLATEVYGTETAPYLEEYSKVAISGKSYEFNSYFAPMDKHFLISAVSPGKNMFSTITNDITVIQKAHEEIDRKNKELENYIYVASHDLRSPLVNIQGFSQRLQKQTEEIKHVLTANEPDNETKDSLAKITNETLPKTLDFILTNVKKMDTLINGLLQVSRTGRITMVITKIDMNHLINTILSHYSFQITEMKAEVSITDLPDCYGDENQLNQLFSNIIGNALKYRDKNRPLELKIAAKTHYNKVIYSISDTGIGIHQRDIEKIWNVFYRVDSTVSEAGDGIGLSLVKRIADKHKGKIWVESKEGKGSTFYVELQKNEFVE